ncbi:cation:proton antiporter domain-containing protein [Tichowtungia aerotolerans]|uniref:Sodium:proton antiporter n=1 Tax=Tichowtungia aerotolerans TaxID=2697043 RepID=A0A6P1MB92_9BACT|nr:cation:proton antiporter [Tichowtungia aerotolerans]QHI70373.1 sodium:proton antiporter [Tichowtungia aerotolerans]
MAVSLAELILIGLLADWLFRKCRLPGLIGLLLLGIVAGPCVLNVLAPDFRAISKDLRLMALIVILLRAGFELSRDALEKAGWRTIALSCVPGIFEGVTITLLGPRFLPLTTLEAAMLGFIIAAVSPAVVVPLMIRFIEEKRGAQKAIPTMVLAAASLDDVVAITIFTVLLGLYGGESVRIGSALGGIPVSILLGIGAGLLTGWILLKLFEKFNPRATKRTLIVVGVSILLVRVQQLLDGHIPFAALLAVMALGFLILEKREHMAHELSSKLGKIWVFASILLFTLVGAQVDISVAVQAGLAGLALIVCGVMMRSAGVLLCLAGSSLTTGERLFVTVAYWPKATVQAAIGAVPLGLMSQLGRNQAPGEIILAVAVMSILFTAPIGAAVTSWAGHRFLSVDTDEHAAFDAARESEA